MRDEKKHMNKKHTEISTYNAIVKYYTKGIYVPI